MSLRKLLSEMPAAAEAMEVMIFDNSPELQDAPADFNGLYISDTANPGLATAYNRALSVAAEAGMPWLLLLDQDTSLTEAYLNEVLQFVSKSQPAPGVVALVPKLADGSLICSPMMPPKFGPAGAISSEWTGIAEQPLHVFNSGALVNVEALKRVGGFPADFPLDYLDHATFSLLQKAGGKLHILRASLAHELSSNHEAAPGSAAAARQQSVLDAERRFYAQYGTVADRLLRRVRLLRGAAGRVVRGKEWSQTWRMLRSALRP